MEMMPIVNELKEEFEGMAEVISLNAALNPNRQLQTNLGLTGHPSIAILDSEERVTQRFYGYTSFNELSNALEAVTEDK